MYTLKVESFEGRNFRDFANFSVVRESLYPRNRSVQVIRDSKNRTVSILTNRLFFSLVKVYLISRDLLCMCACV